MARYKVLKPSGDLIALDSPMVGATDMVSGVGGIVPTPQIGDQNKVLMGNGQFENVVQGIKGDAETDYKTGNVNLTYSDIGTAAQGRVALGLGDANGALPITIAQGGTGLTASPSMLTNLGSTSADDVLKASPRPGITGTLGFSNGGTGATSRLNAAKALTNESVTSPAYLIGMTSSWGKFGYVSPANARTFLNIPFSLLDYLGATIPSDTSAINFWRTIVPVENRTVFTVTPGAGAGGASSSSPWGATNTNRSSGVNKIGAYSCKLATLTTSSPYSRGQCEKTSSEYRIHLMTGSESNYVFLAAYIVGNKIQNFKIYEMYNSSSNSYTVLMGMIF